MIELTPLARPYAKAVFASALDTDSIDEIKEELKTITLSPLISFNPITLSPVSYTHLTLPTNREV